MRHFRNFRNVTAIAATDNPRMPSEHAQGPCQVDYQRRFAATAHGYIADNYHRHRQTFAMQQTAAIQGSPDARKHDEQQRKGKQQAGRRAAPPPDGGKSAGVSAAPAGWQRKCATVRPAGLPA